MLTRYCVVDVATAPIAGVEDYIEVGSAPGQYKKPDAIATWKQDKRVELIDRAGLDLDLARITGVAVWVAGASQPLVQLCRTEDEERAVLESFPLEDPYIGFNSLKFDWPMLMRRARYLGVSLHINTDKYRTPNIDLSDVLTHHGVLAAKSLDFYCKRLGWSDLLPKPLSGEEESRVPVTGAWDQLAASLRRDVRATSRLAQWLDVIPVKTAEMSADQALVGF